MFAAAALYLSLALSCTAAIVALWPVRDALKAAGVGWGQPLFWLWAANAVINPRLHLLLVTALAGVLGSSLRSALLIRSRQRSYSGWLSGPLTVVFGGMVASVAWLLLESVVLDISGYQGISVNGPLTVGLLAGLVSQELLGRLLDAVRVLVS